jgi:hypothetical protein
MSKQNTRQNGHKHPKSEILTDFFYGLGHELQLVVVQLEK